MIIFVWSETSCENAKIQTEFFREQIKPPVHEKTDFEDRDTSTLLASFRKLGTSNLRDTEQS